MTQARMLSIIIPIYNEAQNLAPLHQRLTAALRALGRPYEIILVNDGSTDGSDTALDALAAGDPNVKVVHFQRNFGQTAAMMAGIRYASGDIIIPMDGDLQNDPADIAKLLAKLEEGYDVVSGWRQDRKDHPIRRNLPSRVANWLISGISGVRLHDYGCSLKAYRKEVVKGVKLYGEMHRFIPIYATWEGGKVAEVPVTHHPRVHGESKYGAERVLKVVLDLIVVQFLARYANRPIYLFGGIGICAITLSILAGVWAVYLKYFENTSFIQTPLPMLVVMLFVTGGMSILMGLLAEIIMRTYYESQGKAVYLVKRTANLGPGAP
jgi:glycosyltransferase involved in cell wall biosynthesis